jgi:very-short-patch-repair endonuclease
VSSGVEEPSRIERLREFAERQHGVFTLAQALESGYSRSTVYRRVAAGEWSAPAPQVFRVEPSSAASWRTATMAYTLSIGGAACRQSALALHGLFGPPAEPEIVVLRTRRTGARAPAPSTDRLPPIDLTVVDGIRTTAPPRTLIDVAGRLPRARFEDVLDTAIVRRAVTVDRLRARAQDLWAPRRNGCAIVLELLAARDPGLHLARNVWEAKVVREARRLGLPTPCLNFRVRVGGRVRYLDLAWPDAKVAVEFDGFVPHSTRRVFDDDRLRQNDLVAAGWIVFRVTKTMLDADPTATFAPIATAIAGKR